MATGLSAKMEFPEKEWLRSEAGEHRVIAYGFGV
jgi:hypothetical protein